MDANDALRVKAEVDRLRHELATVDGQLKQLKESSQVKPEDIPRLKAEYERLASERDKLLAEFWQEYADRLGPAGSA